MDDKDTAEKEEWVNEVCTDGREQHKDGLKDTMYATLKEPVSFLGSLRSGIGTSCICHKIKPKKTGVLQPKNG